VLWRSEDVVAAALGRPVAHTPGGTFFYDDVSIHLLSILLTRLSGMSTAAFAKMELFRQIGIWSNDEMRFVWLNGGKRKHILSESGRWPDDGLPWIVDGFGHNVGAFGLHLTVREMAALGLLYLNGGTWGGTQMIPADFVAASTTRHTSGGPPVGQAYGYGWWIPEPHRAFFATGLGAQTIHVVPGLDVVTAFTTQSNHPGGVHRRRLIEDFVIPAIRQG
jgi:CubicO group peptidase (beta-lactamase class C family)